MRRLIVNADDFGSCRGSVDGIVHGHRHGIVTSASFMAGMPAAVRAIEAARACPGSTSACTSTSPRDAPCSPPPRSRASRRPGRFLASRAWLASRRKPDPLELEREFRAQIGRAAPRAWRRATWTSTRTSGTARGRLPAHRQAGRGARLAIRFPSARGGSGWGPPRQPRPASRWTGSGSWWTAAGSWSPLPGRAPRPDGRRLRGPAARSGESLARQIAGLGEGRARSSPPGFVRGSLLTSGLGR